MLIHKQQEFKFTLVLVFVSISKAHRFPLLTNVLDNGFQSMVGLCGLVATMWDLCPILWTLVVLSCATPYFDHYGQLCAHSLIPTLANGGEGRRR